MTWWMWLLVGVFALITWMPAGAMSARFLYYVKECVFLDGKVISESINLQVAKNLGWIAFMAGVWTALLVLVIALVLMLLYVLVVTLISFVKGGLPRAAQMSRIIAEDFTKTKQVQKRTIKKAPK